MYNQNKAFGFDENVNEINYVKNLKTAICSKTAVCIELELRFRGCLAK